MIKYLYGITLFVISLNSTAQPIVVKCTLETTYTRDGVLEVAYSGIFCNDCRLGIKVLEDGRTLNIDGLLTHGAFWNNRDGKLDSNGFGGRASWSINSEEISASEDIYTYGNKNGYASLTISRLTGRFYSVYKIKNPIGRGNIEEIVSGNCQASKSAF